MLLEVLLVTSCVYGEVAKSINLNDQQRDTFEVEVNSSFSMDFTSGTGLVMVKILSPGWKVYPAICNNGCSVFGDATFNSMFFSNRSETTFFPSEGLVFASSKTIIITKAADVPDKIMFESIPCTNYTMGNLDNSIIPEETTISVSSPFVFEYSQGPVHFETEGWVILEELSEGFFSLSSDGSKTPETVWSGTSVYVEPVEGASPSSFTIAPPPPSDCVYRVISEPTTFELNSASEDFNFCFTCEISAVVGVQGHSSWNFMQRKCRKGQSGVMVVKESSTVRVVLNPILPVLTVGLLSGKKSSVRLLTPSSSFGLHLYTDHSESPTGLKLNTPGWTLKDDSGKEYTTPARAEIEIEPYRRRDLFFNVVATNNNPGFLEVLADGSNFEFCRAERPLFCQPPPLKVNLDEKPTGVIPPSFSSFAVSYQCDQKRILNFPEQKNWYVSTEQFNRSAPVSVLCDGSLDVFFRREVGTVPLFSDIDYESQLTDTTSPQTPNPTSTPNPPSKPNEDGDSTPKPTSNPNPVPTQPTSDDDDSFPVWGTILCALATGLLGGAMSTFLVIKLYLEPKLKSNHAPNNA